MRTSVNQNLVDNVAGGGMLSAIVRLTDLTLGDTLNLWAFGAWMFEEIRLVV